MTRSTVSGNGRPAALLSISVVLTACGSLHGRTHGSAPTEPPTAPLPASDPGASESAAAEDSASAAANPAGSDAGNDAAQAAANLPPCLPPETKSRAKPKPRPRTVLKESPPQLPTAPAVSETPAGGVVDARVAPMPVSVMSILGKRVQGPQGDDLGRVVDVLADASGRVRIAIIDFGGFLGVGDRRIAVDWPLLRFNPDSRDPSLLLSLSKEKLKAAPEYKDDPRPQALMEPGAAAGSTPPAAPTAPAATAAPAAPTAPPADKKQ